MSEWKEVTLGDLINVKHGWAFKGEFFSESSSPKNVIVGIGNFDYSGGFRFESTRLKEYSDSYPKEYELNVGDILLAMTCQTAGGEILGIPGRIPNDQRLYLHNQRLGKIEIKKPEFIDSSFLYWLCLWKPFNHHLVSTASGTKILHTAPDRIKTFKFKCPPIESQKEIGRTLNAIDRKIENLRKQNETLEEIARSIFKHWFIDFEFPNADGKPYKSSGGVMVRSELGDIPEGWRVGKLGDITRVINGRAYKQTEFREKGTPIVRIQNLTGKGKTVYSDLQLNEDKYINSGDLIYAWSATFGAYFWRGDKSIYHYHIWKLECFSSCFKYYLYLHLKIISDSMQGQGTGSIFTHITKELMENQTLHIPNIELMKNWDDVASPVFNKIMANHYQIQTLTKTRDTLLPKLMSGQLRVEE